jgi:hypothetical protein
MSLLNCVRRWKSDAYSIPPNEIMRIDSDTMKCPKYGAGVFIPKKRS